MKYKNKVKRLMARIKDWENTVSKGTDLAKSFKKPGSFNK
jgi:hypothetical protein